MTFQILWYYVPYQRPQNSYVTELFDAGIRRIAQKVGEEAVEVVLASVSEQKIEMVNETADLLFHLFVLLRARDINFSDVILELKDRSQKKNLKF